MSNYDPNRPPASSPETPQVFCPNCKGGNPPDAASCRWCGTPLAPAAAAPLQQPPASYQPTYQQPQPQQPPGYQPQPGQGQTYGPAPGPQPTYQQPPPTYGPQPAYQQPMSPQVPVRKSNRRNILLIVGGVVLLGVALCAVLFLTVFSTVMNATQPMADTGEKFMAALRDGNDQQAYDLCTSALQSDF
ncbi:MAG: hypothetical protein M3328_08055, partial [Chloroflexota bacterium]|nr:hypothetical protein [Chloroflexota bacterium]